jgi:hypothetical protein
MPRVILCAGGRIEGDVAAVEVVFFSGDCYPARAAEFMGPALQRPASAGCTRSAPASTTPCSGASSRAACA